MKKLVLIPFALLGVCSLLIAADKAADAAKQKTCPVSGKPVGDAMAEHNGEKVHFCCSGCKGKFEAEPVKYLPAYYSQLYPQAVQTKCPFSGKPVKAETTVEVEGKKVAFCCDGCKDKYKADPAKFQAKVDAAMTKQVHCPFSGKPIDIEKSVTKDGKTVYFCCDKCIDHAKKDEKAWKDISAEDQGVVAAGPTAKLDVVMCPVCPGMTLERKDAKKLVQDGKAYYFCSEHCLDEFKKDPAKYEKQLGENMKKLQKEKGA